MQREPVSEKSPLVRWFTEPPYIGVLLVVAFFLGIGLAALTQRPEPAGAQVVQVTPPAPPVSVTPGPSAQTPAPDEPAPEVSVRTVPGEEPKKADEPQKPEEEPSTVPAPEATPQEPGVPARTSPTVPDQPGVEAEVPAPEPAPRAPEGVPAPAAPELRPTEPPPRPRPQPAEPAPRPRPSFRPPAREAGDVTVYFDADSSTFDRRGNRLPLRVEVYVNGRKRLESSDPEKRSFNLGRVAEGENEIEIVPYVGDLPARPRREIIRVAPGERARFKAVLRREDGVARVGKFRERD